MKPNVIDIDQVAAVLLADRWYDINKGSLRFLTLAFSAPRPNPLTEFFKKPDQEAP